MKKIAYLNTLDTFDADRTLLKEARETVREKDLHKYLILSAYYQQLILKGYDVETILEEISIPSELSFDSDFLEVLKMSSYAAKLDALANAVYTLRTIGYEASNGFIYIDKVVDCPEIIELRMELMRK